MKITEEISKITGEKVCRIIVPDRTDLISLSMGQFQILETDFSQKFQVNQKIEIAKKVFNLTKESLHVFPAIISEVSEKKIMVWPDYSLDVNRMLEALNFSALARRKAWRLRIYIEIKKEKGRNILYDAANSMPYALKTGDSKNDWAVIYYGLPLKK